ncbi:crossover junction endodeoxyribonuclease [Salmonella enterica subsp. enterica serovar Cerro]|nr:crossover junction endodeoxyribonuclease [Salmonella enterica subsp. enterica serovar Cerro]
MKLILPFPPSVNTYWRHPNKGAFAGKSLISAAGRKFQSAACAAIVEQLRRLPNKRGGAQIPERGVCSNS